jgi:hypothetical protein
MEHLNKLTGLIDEIGISASEDTIKEVDSWVKVLNSYK